MISSQKSRGIAYARTSTRTGLVPPWALAKHNARRTPIPFAPRPSVTAPHSAGPQSVRAESVPLVPTSGHRYLACGSVALRTLTWRNKRRYKIVHIDWVAVRSSEYLLDNTCVGQEKARERAYAQPYAQMVNRLRGRSVARTGPGPRGRRSGTVKRRGYARVRHRPSRQTADSPTSSQGAELRGATTPAAPVPFSQRRTPHPSEETFPGAT